MTEGLVQTVMGDVAPSELGITLAHEHLLIQFGRWRRDAGVAFERPEATDKRDRAPLTLDNVGWVRRYDGSHTENHLLDDIDLAIEEAQRFVDAVFAEADVFHAPTINMPVPSIAETDVKASPNFPAIIAGMTHCTRPINYLGLPSLAVPAGFTDNGLPASFQLIGRPFAEATLYRVASAYEAETKFADRAPDD